jgi:predicted nucleotidyltransferase
MPDHSTAINSSFNVCIVISCGECLWYRNLMLRNELIELLKEQGGVRLALLFGSVAEGKAVVESDLDLAVLMEQKISSELRMRLIGQIALISGRPVDLIDLSVVGEPLLGQILKKGERLLGSDGEYGRLLSKHLFDQADFMPYRKRILAERRAAWIGS